MKLLLWIVLIACVFRTTTAAGISTKNLFNALKGQAFSGDCTYYTPGPGSCGEIDTEDELVVAVNMPQMHNGLNPNNNEHCNKYVYIKGAKGQVKARIVDTCPKCTSGGLDVSPKVFKAVCGNLAIGRCSILWKWM